MLHSYKAVYVPGKGIARFIHLQQLNEIQQEEGLRAANRLTARYIQFQRQKMKVKLAVHLFSSSVAKGLQLARELKIKGFEQSEPTKYMCTVIDRLFDNLNSTSPRGHRCKGPLTI